MRGFEKISYKEFEKNFNNAKEMYSDYKLPSRKTSSSAGYDFMAVEDFTILPNEIIKVKTGIKAWMQCDEVLNIYIRSSLGFKYNIRLCNQVGVIDSDYYNNPDNEGHIFIALQNEGDKELIVKKGEGFAQGVFSKYLVGNDVVDTKRIGGIGSTNERNKKNEK